MADDVFCNQCGHRNPPGSNFCSSCGAPLATLREDPDDGHLRPRGGPRATTTWSVELGDMPAGVGLLVVKRGPNVGSRFALDADVVQAGRHPESDIFLDDITVSRRHAEIVREDDGYVRARRRLAQRDLPQPRAGRVGAADRRRRAADRHVQARVPHGEGRCTVTRAPTDRSHLSIGEVLSLLQDEFPDVTISKIRFLESQGLLDPERTPSGYRKFYEADIDRLRWILRQQKDHYLPLKVIKDRLDEAARFDRSHGMRAPSATANDGGGRRGGVRAGTRRPRTGRRRHRPWPSTSAGPRPPAADALPARRPAPAAPPERARPPTAGAERGRRHRGARAAGPAPPPPAADPAAPNRRPPRRRPRAAARCAGVGRLPGSVSLTVEELAQASGLAVRAVRDLEGYGLIERTPWATPATTTGTPWSSPRRRPGSSSTASRPGTCAATRWRWTGRRACSSRSSCPSSSSGTPTPSAARQTVAELVRLGDQMRSVLLPRAARPHPAPA